MHDDWNQLEDRPQLASVRHRGVELRAGTRVRVYPRHGAPACNRELFGRIAVVDAIEQDFEERFHVAVVLDETLDVGSLQSQRYFFFLEDIEPVLPDQ